MSFSAADYPAVFLTDIRTHFPQSGKVHIYGTGPPIKIIDERISCIRLSGIEVSVISAGAITAVLPEKLHLQPVQLSILEAA